MSLELHEVKVEEISQNGLIEIKIIGKLQKDDYDVLVPFMEDILDRNDKVRMLVELVDFEGWSAGAVWEDTKFGLKHFLDIDRIAFIGDRKWEKRMSLFCKVFTKAEVRFYEPDNVRKAKYWLSSPSD